MIIYFTYDLKFFVNLKSKQGDKPKEKGLKIAVNEILASSFQYN